MLQYGIPQTSEKTSMTPHYAIVIEWSDQDQAYVVSLPEWAERYAQPVADGATYEEAAARGHNALEHLIQIAQEDGEALPNPRVFVAPGA